MRHLRSTGTGRLGGLAPAFAAALLAAPLASVPATTARAATAYGGYVMGYFTESNQGIGNNYGLHLAVSADGLEWTPLNQNAPVVTPTAGTKGLRDPFILRKQDGTFTVLATDLAGTDFSQPNMYIHVWDSPDLRSFTNYRRVQVHSMTTTHARAPEAFWDASRGRYALLYSANNGTRNVIMADYTNDFTTFSQPVTYFDPGFDVIDADVVVGGSGTNYLYYKKESDQSLYGAKATSLAAGAFNSTTYTGPLAHGGTEAPILVKSLTGNGWTLWGDTYTPNGVFYAWQTSAVDSGTWTAADQRTYTQPINSKHGTVTPLTAAEMNNLKATWGTPGWSRLKSYNYPARFVRHSAFAGRIDAFPFDPYPDAEWKIVPGLADGAGVSFESVNFPGRYLRHSGFAVVLDPADGTAQFASDATFYRTAGLADSAATSYRSYNYPDRYLRHANFQLRIDPLSAASSATDRADATFLVTS
ncbi:glycoside hydrolase family 43 protein [Kitasatospora sp. NBC_00240]|uniref:glycoside hydrolase family 43 protein n=1 Tax=Kitasatospora sp. NBC_00240 TaxID=2903567 RepID=UPI002253666E|nr:glycoside hydrolase family 43 protein [Kitasatospora sp. NBC_00240]MCX5208862.1 glycoside hydrolase family 43 protein [Kitasatospora sp. NBC_00240]